MGSGERDEERKKLEAENRSKGKNWRRGGARDVLFQLPLPCPLSCPTYFEDICSFFAFDVAVGSNVGLTPLFYRTQYCSLSCHL